MPEKYNCIDIGIEGYPVWLTLSDKVTIVAIEPTKYHEVSSYGSPQQVLLMTVVTLVVKGTSVEVMTPSSVESVCRILGFIWDEGGVLNKSAPAEHPGKDTVAEAVPAEESKPGGGLK